MIIPLNMIYTYSSASSRISSLVPMSVSTGLADARNTAVTARAEITDSTSETIMVCFSEFSFFAP